MIRRVWIGAVRVGGFTSSMVLLAVASLLMIPALIRSGGVDAWGSIVIGQAIGAIAATVIGYGYGVTGPSAVARADVAEARSEFLGSLLTRSVILGPGLAIVWVLSMIIPSPDRPLAFVASLPIVLGGITASFFYIGRSSPVQLLLLETMPRFLFTLLAVWVMVSGGSVLSGLLLQLVGVVVGLLASMAWILRFWSRNDRRRVRIRPLRQMLREQLQALTASLLTALYGGLPVIIVGFVSPVGLASFGVFHKLQRQLAVAASPVSTVFQGWVPRRLKARYSPVKAIATALGGTVVVAAVIVLVMGVAGQAIFDWLSAGQLHAEQGQVLLSGLIVAGGLIQASLSYACLVPLGGIRDVMLSNVVGIAVGLGLLPLLAGNSGTTGALAALLIGVLTQILIQSVALARRIRAEGVSDALPRRAEPLREQQ